MLTAVACCLLSFAVPPWWPKHWEVGVTALNWFSLLECDMEWMEAVGYSWNIPRCGKRSSKASCAASVTPSVGEDLVLLLTLFCFNLVCFAKGKAIFSSIECTGKKVCFFKCHTLFM